jgi:hypothetical protein
MSAREYVRQATTIRLAWMVNGRCEARRHALVLDAEARIAVLVESDSPGDSAFRAGAVVHYDTYRDADDDFRHQVTEQPVYYPW